MMVINGLAVRDAFCQPAVESSILQIKSPHCPDRATRLPERCGECRWFALISVGRY